jgi:hypothetical protein
MSAFGRSGSLRRLIPFAFLLLSAACATPGSPETSPAETTGSGGSEGTDSPASDSGSRTSGAGEKHVLIILQLTRARLDVLTARTVDAPLPGLRVPRPEPWRVDVEDATGKAVFSVSIPAANALRGEFAPSGGAIDGIHLRTDKAVFPLRVPVSTTAARLRVMGAVWTLDSADPRARGRSAEQIVELGVAAYPRISP